MGKQSIAVVTGATNGIGQLAAIQFAKQGFELVLTARSKEKALESEKIIKAAAPNTTIEFFFCDLSLMKEVIRVGEEIKQKYPKIDVLVNNAGLHAFAQRITSEGFSEMIAVNYLAPWLLTHILQKNLINAGTARIVNTASRASRNHGKLSISYDLIDKSNYSAKESSQIYGKTKLFDIMFTAELARRLDTTGVTANVICPGFNVTGLGRELRFSNVIAKVLNFLHIGDPRKGGEIIFRVSVDKKYENITGHFFAAGTGEHIAYVFPEDDVDLQQQLWNESEKLLHEHCFI